MTVTRQWKVLLCTQWLINTLFHDAALIEGPLIGSRLIHLQLCNLIGQNLQPWYKFSHRTVLLLVYKQWHVLAIGLLRKEGALHLGV